MDVEEQFNNWMSWDPNPETRAEIQKLKDAGDEATLRKFLGSRLSFGTAGIRGPMRAGFTGMNDLVIVQTSQGLASYLIEHFGQEASQKGGVVIGFDGRYHSSDFALFTARAMRSKGIPVYLYTEVVPTPFVPYGITHFGCVAGVMVTASHNPKEDNGYKVYFSNGAQIYNPDDKNILKSILKNLVPWDKAFDIDTLDGITYPLEEIKKKYFKEMTDRIVHPDTIKDSKLGFVFTTMHGVGHKYMMQAFGDCGFQKFFPVKEQQEPDPEFPTVKFPNPEEGKGVLDLSFKTANRNGCTVIVANDPDADRCALAEKSAEGGTKWRVFSGNEIGTLVGWWLWTCFKKTHPEIPPSECYMLCSSVSSKFLQCLAEKEGFNFHETLTGFKYMGNKADELIKSGKTVIFAFEESIGYMCGTAVLDKDGVSAAMEMAQLAVYLEKTYNRTLNEQLLKIYEEYGYHTSIVSYFICYEKPVIDRIFHRLCHWDDGKEGTYPLAIGGIPIYRIRDLSQNFDSATVDKKPELPCSSKSYMLTMYFENGITISIRTSGTEPKIKYYSELRGSPGSTNWSELDAQLKCLVQDVITACLQPELNGLLPQTD